MEEKETSTPKLTYEQLEQAVMHLKQRAMISENSLKSIDFTSMRLAWLFKVLENKESFPAEFINKCAKEVEELLTLEEEIPDTEAEKA